MRVGIVTPWFPTQVNPSSGAFVLKDSQALREAGVDLSVVHLVPPHEDDGSRKTVVSGIRTIRVPMSTSNPLDIVRARLEIAPLIKDFDVVHTQAISAIEPFVFGRPKQFWVHTEHWSGITNPQTLPASWQKLRPALLKMELLPDVAGAVCDYLAQPLRRIRGSKPVEVIPCQVPSPAKVVARRERDGVIRLVSTGALAERKDPLLAVRVLDELRKRGFEATLTWLGDGPLRGEAISLATELGVDAKFPGTVDKAGVQKALTEADVFIGPTQGENFFVAAAEAIVNGRPLVVGANGGHGEYIDPAIGRLMSVQDAVGYADAVVDLFENTADWDAQRIAATVGDSFEPHTIATSYIDLYKRGIEKRGF